VERGFSTSPICFIPGAGARSNCSNGAPRGAKIVSTSTMTPASCGACRPPGPAWRRAAPARCWRGGDPMSRLRTSCNSRPWSPVSRPSTTSRLAG